MKRFIVGVLVFALMLLGPIAEAGDKRHSKHGSKTHAAKVAKAKVTKAKIVKSKSGKVRLAKVQYSKGKKSVKAGKTKKYAQAKLGKTGRKFVATKNQRHAARSSAAQHAGASSRIARYAPGPVEAVRTDSLRFDYGDALTDGELELRSAAALGGRSENRRSLVREKLGCQRANRLDHQIDDGAGDP
jgi:hypothetical protein